MVTTGSQAWTEGEDGVWTSGGKGVNNATSRLEMHITSDCTLTITYRCWAEKGWDFLTIWYDAAASTQNVVLVDKNTNPAVGDQNYTLTIELKAGDMLIFQYSKDSGGNQNEDCAKILSIEIG